MEAGPREPVNLDSRTSYRSELLKVGITSSSYFEKAGRLKAEISIVAHGSCHGASRWPVHTDGRYGYGFVLSTDAHCHSHYWLGLPISIGPLD